MPEPGPICLEELLKLHPADLADRLQRMEGAEARKVFGELPAALAAATLKEMVEESAAGIVEDLSDGQLGALLIELPPNAAADVVAALPPGCRRDVMAAMPTEKASPIRALLRYPEDTAGGIMNDRFIALQDGLTVEQAQELLRARPEDRADDVSYLYVTDAGQRLVGVVSLRQLVFSRRERRISEIMSREVKFLQVDDDQEKIARQFEHYHYLGLPVLDREGRLVGMVKASDALRIAQAEATEDMQLMVGLSGEERAHAVAEGGPEAAAVALRESRHGLPRGRGGQPL